MVKWRYWLFGPTLPFVLLVAIVSLATWQAPWEVKKSGSATRWVLEQWSFTISCFYPCCISIIHPLTEATQLPSTWVQCKVHQERQVHTSNASNASADEAKLPKFVNCSRPIPARKQTPQLGPLTGAPLRRTNSQSFRFCSNRCTWWPTSLGGFR